MRYLVLIFVLYLIYKYGKYALHSLSRSTTGAQSQYGGGSNSPNNKVHIDVNPKTGEKKFEEGEYIDFEEVD